VTIWFARRVSVVPPFVSVMGNVSGKSDSHGGGHISRKELDRFQRRWAC
jgi:hypothetical protein